MALERKVLVTWMHAVVGHLVVGVSDGRDIIRDPKASVWCSRPATLQQFLQVISYFP